MASYEAQINLLVSGQQQLDRLSDRLRSIERQIIDINRLGVSPQQRDPVTGRFGADPDRANRIRLRRLQEIDQQERRRAFASRRLLQDQNAELLNSIRYHSQLNAAVDLYQRKLEELSRGGGGRRLTQDLRDQVDQIERAFDAATAGGTTNLRLVRSLATELGRVVERQNEINRLSTFQSKAFFQAQAFERRMAQLRAEGAGAGSFGGVGRQMRSYRSAISRGSEFEANDIARRIKEALNRIQRELDASAAEARALARAANENLRQQQEARNAQRRLQAFFDDAANQALMIRQNARHTAENWRAFFEDASQEAVRLREQQIQGINDRLNRFKRLQGDPSAYSGEIGPLPAGRAGGPRYFQEAQQIAKELLDVENEIGSIREQSLNKSLQLETDRLKLVEKRKQKEAEIRDVLLDAISFGKSADVKRTARNIATGSRNALVRGGLGLGALGIGGIYEGISNIGNIDLGLANTLKGPAATAASAIGGSINDALGGIPAIVNSVLSALGDIPSALGLAAVAAYAFAPAMKTAGDAVFLAGKKFGESKFGQNIKLTLDRQTNLFESVINAATEMNMVLDASKSGLDAVGQKIESLPMLPAAGQTSFAGEMRKGRGGAFMGGGAREIFNPEYLVTATGQMAQRTEMSATASLLFAKGLGQAANEAKTIADYLKEASDLRVQTETKTQQFIRETIQKGRAVQRDQQTVDEMRRRSAMLQGGQYSLAQVPAGGELFPGGRTETRMPDYRQMLNNAATVAQLQQEILDAMSKQQGFAATIGQIERRTINDKGQSLKNQQDENAELERSIQIIRERNRELRARPLANMTPQERLSAGMLDPQSLRQQRLLRVQQGRARQEAFARARSEALVGGAFPLLFGQGIGGAIGGGLGGFAGGMMGDGLGFGLSLLGTTIGGLFDQLGKAAEDTGKSLNYPIEGFNKLKEANLFASRQQEYYISKLIESGQITKAQSEIQAEIIKKVGIGGVNDLMALGDASSRLSKAWASFTLELQAALAGPMAGLLDWITSVVTLSSGGIQKQAAQFNPGAFNEAQVKAKDKAMQGRFIGVMNEKIYQEELNRLSAQIVGKYNQNLKITPAQTTQQDREGALNKAMEVADKIRGINEQGIALQRSADDLRLNIEDTVYGLRKRATDMEREAINFRRSIEDEIVGKRQELEKMIIDNDRARQQNAIDALDLQLQKASSGLDPIAQGVVDAAREYIRTRAEGEGDLQQKERQLKLELQQIDQEVNKYKLQVEERVSQMSLQREEFTRDVSRTKLQTERQIGDYVISVEKYRLEMAKLRVDEAIREGKIAEAAAIARQQGLSVSPTGRNYANVGGFMGGRQMLHGIPGFAGYDAAHAGGNAHYHFAGQNPAETKAVADFLKGSGFKITEFGQYGQNVGRHAPGSQHYRAQGFNAFDVPGSQVPVGQEIPMMRRIHALVNDFLGTGGVNIAPMSLSQVQASKPLPTPPSAPTMPELPATPQMIQINDLMAQYRDLQKQIQEQMIKANATERESLAIKLEAARLQYENQVLAPIRQFEEENRQLQVEIENRKERNRLAAEGYSPEIIEGKIRVLELDRALNSVLAGQQKAANEQAVAAMKKLGLNTQLIDSTFNLTEATAAELLLTTQDTKKKEELRKELEQILKLKNDIAGKTLATADNARFGIQQAAAASVMSPQERMQEQIGTLNQEMAKLLDNTNLIIGAAESIGNAFSQSFAGVINRTMTAQEALGSFFQNVANYFLDMAGQILTKTIEIQSSKMLRNLFPSIFGFSRGGAFGMNGIQPFARGGIVTSPTLFKFANGGALQAGLMGEAGPEAIIPLKRGSGGRLGVEAFGSAPTNDQAGAGIDPFAENRMAMATAQDAKAKRESQQALSSGVPVTEIKYNRVGSGDLPFVTEETMLEATRAAIEQGAKLGQRRTIAVLRNDPSARRSVGL